MFDFDLDELYWPQLTAAARALYAGSEIREPAAVIDILQACFSYLEQEFMALIAAETRSSFYVAVHDCHEDTTALWIKQLEGVSLPVNKSNFAAVRRVLKLILEQGCGNDLQDCANFEQEIEANATEYLTTLERLLWLGYWANGVAGYISRAQMFPDAIGIRFGERGIDFVIYEPFATVLDYIDQDIFRHRGDVVLHDTIQQLRKLFTEKLGLDFDYLTGWVGHLPELTVVGPKLLLAEVSKKGYDRAQLSNFFAGLTLSRANKLTFRDCIIRSQDINRYLYRPILSLQIGGNEYWLVNVHKWMESLVTLTTNALPFGICPPEWKAFPHMARFISQVEGEHDKTLEAPLADILRQQGFVYQLNVGSIYNGQRTITLRVENVGQIDLLYIDHVQRVLYVCECKHNRSKFDAAGWRRDDSNFVRDYETQLANKQKWAAANLDALSAHFTQREKRPIDLSGYEVVGIFVINAPTMYLYDGAYPTYTIFTFRQLVEGTYQWPPISYTPPGSAQVHLIERPYMKNAARLFAALSAEASASAK